MEEEVQAALQAQAVCHQTATQVFIGAGDPFLKLLGNAWLRRWQVQSVDKWGAPVSRNAQGGLQEGLDVQLELRSQK